MGKARAMESSGLTWIADVAHSVKPSVGCGQKPKR